MSDGRWPTTIYKNDGSEEWGWESIGTSDIDDDSDPKTAIDVEELEDLYVTAAREAENSVSCQTGNIAEPSAACIDYDDSTDNSITEDVELEELLDLEKDDLDAEQDSIPDPPSTNNSVVTRTDSVPSKAPFYPPGLVLPTPGSALEFTSSETLGTLSEYNEDSHCIEPNIMGVPVLMSTAELIQGELWLYGEQHLAQYRCRSPSPLRICWTSIWV